MLENVCYHRIDYNTVQLSCIDDQKVDSSLIVGVRLSVIIMNNFTILIIVYVFVLMIISSVLLLYLNNMKISIVMCKFLFFLLFQLYSLFSNLVFFSFIQFFLRVSPFLLL